MTMMDYHMENLDRYSTEGFVPTNEDMLRARQRTTGFLPTSFMVSAMPSQFNGTKLARLKIIPGHLLMWEGRNLNV